MSTSFDMMGQVRDAMSAIDVHESAYLRWPFPALDELTGGMAPGTVWMVGAFSGGGKTMFTTSCIRRWLDAGKNVYVLPLEQKANLFRAYLACQSLGIDPGDALSGAIPEGDPRRDQIKAAIALQRQAPMDFSLQVDASETISSKTIEAAFRRASDAESDVLIVDHIDHIQGGDGSNVFAESKRVVSLLLELAKAYDITVLATTQLNLSVVKGPDKLAKYQPPGVDHIYMGGHKVHVATGIIGLFRPPRLPAPGEDVKAFGEALKRARAGIDEPWKVLEPNTAGVVLMKSRNYGSREGARIKLGVRGGVCIDYQHWPNSLNRGAL